MINVRCGQEWIVRLQDGDNVVEALRSLAPQSAWILSGIGMLRDTVLAYWNGQTYEEHPHGDPTELVSLQGNLGVDESGSPLVHAHVCLAARDGTVSGGHLVHATAHNTVELALLPLDRITLSRCLEPSGLVGLFPRAN